MAKEFIDKPLEEDEFLLKTYFSQYDRPPITKGFLTKLNQDGSIPVNFLKWAGKDNPYTRVVEDFKSGWRVHSARFGESQNWATLMHPDGYTVEIYMMEFIKLLQNNTMINGELVGEFKWSNKILIRK